MKIVIALIGVSFFVSCNGPSKNLKIYNRNGIENISDDDIITAVVLYHCDSPKIEKTSVLNNIKPEEIRYLDTLGKNCRIIKIRSAYYEELPESILKKNFFPILAALLAAIAGSIGAYI